MSGLKTATDGTNTHPGGHGDSMTKSAQRGRVGEKSTILLGQDMGQTVEKPRVQPGKTVPREFPRAQPEGTPEG